MPQPTLWSPEMDATLMDMASRGCSGSAIGRHFGKSRNAVLGRLFRLNGKIAPQRETFGNRKKAILRQMELNGYTPEQIAVRLNRSPETIKRHMADMARVRATKGSKARRAGRTRDPYQPRPYRKGRTGAPVAVIGVSLRDIGFGQCRFPMWPTNESGDMFCGAPVEPLKSWCTGHCGIVFVQK